MVLASCSPSAAVLLTDNGCATDRGEQHAFLLEANTQLVDGAIGAVNSLLATGMDWDQVKVCVLPGVGLVCDTAVYNAGGGGWVYDTNPRLPISPVPYVLFTERKGKEVRMANYNPNDFPKWSGCLGLSL
jgi:hypothetical protein